MRVLYMRKTRKIRKGGMQDFNQMIISNYSPITSKGGTPRKRVRRTKRNTKRTNRNKKTKIFPFTYIR